MIQTVNQHWDPLKVCAVGRTYPPEFYERIGNIKVRDAMQKIAVETEEDLQKIVSKLEEFNVKVLRTDISDNLDDHWQIGNRPTPPPMIPRDHCAAVGGRFFMPSDHYGDNLDIHKIYHQIISDKFEKVNTPEHRLLASMLEETLDPNNLSTAGSILRMRTKKMYFKSKYAFTALDIKKIKTKILEAETMQIGGASSFVMNKDFYAFGSIKKWCEDNNIPIVLDEYINTAMMTRVGKDLYFGYGNKFNKINEERFHEKINRLFPDHRTHFLHTAGHTDGGFVPVVPGLIITLRDIQNYEKTFPGWEVVQLPSDSTKNNISDFMKMKEKMKGRWWIQGEENNDDLISYVDSWLNHWVTYVEESVFDTNMLVIDPKNVIILADNPIVTKAFERYGITAHVINYRHRFFWDGGIHCITTDIVRDGEQVDYFPERGSALKYWPHYTGSL